MKTCIQDWLGSRLGIVIDLSAEHFARHTKDGRLLAKLLYSYGAIPLQIYNSIKSTKHVNECYNNLKVLKPWLEYLEVPVKDEILYEIASSQGTASIHLFYALYLSLQNKDRLHYLSAQKERRYSDDCNKRQIKVDWVPERSVMAPQSENESDLALPIVQKQYMIDWHREKCNALLQKIRCIKENYSKSLTDAKTVLGPITSRHATTKKLSREMAEIENTEKDLKEFAEKHAACLPDLSYDELIALQNQINSTAQKPVPNFNDARGYVNSIKQKSRRGIIVQTFQEDMQTLMIDELWEQVKRKQDENFEDTVCKNLLKQSQYEKQMCSKLALMKHQKDILVKNRKMIDLLKTEHLQKEYDDGLNYKMEIAAEDALDEEFERQKMLELHKRMYIEKVRLKFEERQKDSKSILDKLIDIAIRISEFRESYACEIPKHLMKDMKELFFKDLPIFDIIEDVEELYKIPICDRSVARDDGQGLNEEEEEEEELGEDYDDDDDDDGLLDFENEGEIEMAEKEECGEQEEYDSFKAAEFIRQEVLNECDLNDYLFLLGPWTVDTLISDEEITEVNQSVLGYIVHKILEYKYPSASVPIPANIKPMNPKAVVQGSGDEVAFNMLSELMELKKILVVRVDEAINFVLRAYKEELSTVREIDITFQQATKVALKGKGGTEKLKEPTKKEQLLKKEVSQMKDVNVVQPNFKEVATQTPRNIPEDDPLLSMNAEIGKSAFEALGIGDPVPDMTVISAVIAYVISVQENYDGWILWNYPVLYSQASKLECALTGYQLIAIDDEMDTVEGIEGFDCRMNCADPSAADEFANKRTSRLVPKLESNKAVSRAESYFTSFIKLRKKGGEAVKSSAMLPTLGQDYIEKFYTEQELFYTFEYSSISFQTIKDIGKVLLGETNENNQSVTDLVAKASLEIFGSGLLELNEKFNPPRKKPDKESKKPVETPKKGKNEPEAVASQTEEEEEEEQMEEMAQADEMKDRETKKSKEFTARDKRPGDPEWEWATGPLTDEFQLALATFWENMETIYLEDFKTLFLCLRIHRSKTIKYKAFLKKALQNIMMSEDGKQAILSDFQHKFNDIDDDLRPDSDIKCELHVRVSELEEALFHMADERKEKSERYRIQFINDNWVADELSNLVNLYAKAVQLEADRCIDSCQFINDYYLAIQQRIPQEKPLQKIYAPKLQIYERNYSIISSMSKSLQSAFAHASHQSISNRISRGSVRWKNKIEEKFDSVNKCGTEQADTRTLPEGSEAIIDIMANLSFIEDESTPYHSFFLDLVEDMRNSVKDLVENCLAEAKRVAAPAAGPAAGKDKKKTAEVKVEVNGQVIAEWTAALESELSRFLYRMRLIQMKGIIDFNEFLLTILQTLIAISDEIGEIYMREVTSISECCKVFRCAIEEETAIQPRLELNVDEFIINQGCLLFPSSLSDEIPASLPDTRYQFTMEQLSFMVKKLQFIAPTGEIIRRSFLYILEDLRVTKSEDGVPRLLPDLWDNLNPNDLPFVFDHIYHRTEIVNWKDFIIYALELPMPSDVEILSVRSIYRSFDQTNSELVNFKDFMSVDLWFENYNPRFDNYEAKEFLFKLFQVDEENTNYTAFLLAFCKDEDPYLGFTKALELSLGKRILIDEYEEEYVSEEGEAEEGLDEEDAMTKASESTVSSGTAGKAHPCKLRYACQCKDPSLYSSLTPTGYEAGEAYPLYLGSKDSSESTSTYDIPCETVTKVILASYPSLPQLCVLLGCKKSLHQTMKGVFDSLSTDGVCVRASKLLKHKFISRLLTSTNKFKEVDIRNCIKSMVDESIENLQSSCTLNWT